MAFLNSLMEKMSLSLPESGGLVMLQLEASLRGH